MKPKADSERRSAPGADEDEIERLSLAYSPKFNRILDAARRDIRKGKGIPHDEFWAEMEAPAATRSRGKQAGGPPKASH